MVDEIGEVVNEINEVGGVVEVGRYTRPGKGEKGESLRPRLALYRGHHRIS